MSRRPCGDDGSVMLLILGFTVVLLGLVAVVADVSVVLLHQRAVAAAADGAAVAAAQQLDEGVFYSQGLQERVPLDERAVAGTVAGYEQQVGQGTRLAGTLLAGGTTVQVAGERDVRLPFSRFVGGGSVTVRSVARARSPVLR